jgi:hypothetical protein
VGQGSGKYQAEIFEISLLISNRPEWASEPMFTVAQDEDVAAG